MPVIRLNKWNMKDALYRTKSDIRIMWNARQILIVLDTHYF
jgi:hypothetical protein